MISYCKTVYVTLQNVEYGNLHTVSQDVWRNAGSNPMHKLFPGKYSCHNHVTIMSHFKNPIFVYIIIQTWQHGIFMHIYSHEYAIFVLFSQNSQGAKDIQEHRSASHTTSTLERSPLSRLQGFSVSRKTLLDGSTVTTGVSQFHSVDPMEEIW